MSSSSPPLSVVIPSYKVRARPNGAGRRRPHTRYCADDVSSMRPLREIPHFAAAHMRKFLVTSTERIAQ